MDKTYTEFLNFAERITIPLFAFKPNSRSEKPDAFGCGFVFQYGTHSYLITTAHLINDNIRDGNDEVLISDNLTDSYIGIDTKISDQGQTRIIKITKIASTFLFTKISHNADSLISSRLDISIAKLPECDIAFKYVESVNYSKSNHEITKFSESMIGNFNTGQHYYVGGYLYNRFNIRDELEREKILFGLTIQNFLNNGEVLLHCNSDDLLPNLKGMSGAPVFNNEYKICGIILRANKNEKTFLALSIQQIIPIIKELEQN